MLTASKQIVAILISSYIVTSVFTTAIPDAHAKAATFPSYDMDGYWWLDDDRSTANAEDNTGYGAGNAAQETDITGVAKNTPLALRVDVSETANQDQNQSMQLQLEYQSGAVSCTAVGGWTTITSSTSNDWALDTGNTDVTDDTATNTDRISGNNRPFSAGQPGSLNDTSNPDSAGVLDFKSGEWEWMIYATDAASDSQQYTFRATDNGTALNAYSIPSNCPRATTAAAASASFTQDNYHWYVNSANEDVTDGWSSVSGIDIGENAPITVTPTAYDPPNSTQELRLRMNFLVSTAALSVSQTYFKLQFRTGTDSDCSTGSWTDVDDTGGGADWEYTSLTDVTDGATLSTARLTGTDVLESYVRSNPSVINPNSATTTQDIEYDFHIIGDNASDATRYLFRAVETDSGGTASTVFADGYTNCAILTTEPGISNLLRHGNVFSGGSEQGFFWAD